MLALAIEIAEKGYLLKIEDLERLAAVPEKIACAVEEGRVPAEAVVGGKIRKLVAAGLKDNMKINLKIGSRLVLSKIIPEYAVLIEIVRGIVEIESEKFSHIVLDDLIYRHLTMTELLELK